MAWEPKAETVETVRKLDDYIDSMADIVWEIAEMTDMHTPDTLKEAGASRESLAELHGTIMAAIRYGLNHPCSGPGVERILLGDSDKIEPHPGDARNT